MNSRAKVQGGLGFTLAGVPVHYMLMATHIPPFLTHHNRTRRGFALIELLVVLGAAALVFSLTMPALLGFRGSSDVNGGAEGVMQTLRRAEIQTVASRGASQWGVHFSTSTSPHRYTLFQGSSYALRVPSSDDVFQLPQGVEIFQVNLLGGGNEVVFGRVTGTTTQPGLIVLRLATAARFATTSIDASGRVYPGGPESAPSGPSLVDSRHVHTVYSRAIATASENIVLSFDGGAVQTTVSIASSIVGGEIDWTGTTLVSGQSETIRIRTHRLNNPDTLFSIHRDRRYNTKGVTLQLSGDTSGTVVEYSADGLTTLKTSVHASTPEWR